MRLYKLNKLVLKITNNPSKLLNGLTSNTLDKPKNSFVDANGKIIATFEQKQISQDEILIVIGKQFLDRVMAHLEKYLKLTKTKIEVTKYKAYFDLDAGYKADEGEFIIPENRAQLIITKKDLIQNVSDEEFTLFRLENNIPIQGIDYDNEMLLNISENFVSYTKGCFLGQEIIARVHNLGKPPKKLVVKYEDECGDAEKKIMTSKCKDKTGRVLGFVFVGS